MNWISVKDRLPKRGDIVVYCSGTQYVSAIGIYWGDENDPLGPIPSRPNWLTWEEVTHWMPLPKPPIDSCEECKNEKVAWTCM